MDKHPQAGQGTMTVRDESALANGLQLQQVYTARVGRVDPGQVELEFEGRCLVADTPYQFRVGDHISLRLMGSSNQQLQFQLAVPPGDQAEAPAQLRNIARAAGLPQDQHSLAAAAVLLENALPLKPATAAAIADLQTAGVPLSPDFLATLRQLWQAGQTPDAGQLQALALEQSGAVSLPGLLRGLPPLELHFADGNRTVSLADYSIAGTGEWPVSANELRCQLRLLHGGRADRHWLGNLLVDSRDELPEQLRLLLDLLEVQQLMTDIEKPLLRISLPISIAEGDSLLQLVYRPLGIVSYKQRYSCRVSMRQGQPGGFAMQFSSGAKQIAAGMLDGDDAILRRYEASVTSDSDALQKAWPVTDKTVSDSDARSPAFVARLPQELLCGIARLINALQERC